MSRPNINLTPERVSAAIVIAAVMTTAPRHIIAALQMESAVIKSDVWNIALAVLSLAFAALEGAALLQIESAQTVANDVERRRLSIIKWLIYISIPATFVLPVFAQSQHRTVNDLLAGYPVLLLLQSALIVAAPMFVISGASTSASVLSIHAGAGARREPVTIKKPASAPAPAPAKPAMPPQSLSAPGALAISPPLEIASDMANAEPTADAERVSVSAATSAGAIDNERLAAMLRDNPNASSSALAAEFSVSAGAIRQAPAWKARKELTQ